MPKKEGGRKSNKELIDDSNKSTLYKTLIHILYILIALMISLIIIVLILYISSVMSFSKEIIISSNQISFSQNSLTKKVTSTDDAINSILKKYNAKSLEQISQGIIKISVKNLSIIEELNSNGKTTVQQNYEYKIYFTPNDTYYSLQLNYKQLKIDSIWDYSTGNKNVKVAIIDTGIDYNHPDLKDNIALGYNSIKNNNDYLDDNGHGTHLAGIVAAESNNEGILGVCPNCSVISIKAFDKNGIGKSSSVIKAIDYAIDNNAKVILFSWGSENLDPALEQTIKKASKSNIVLVGAAGNDNSTNLRYPAAYNEVIGVAAKDADFNEAYFSNYGNWTEISAPGIRVLSTMPTYKVTLNKKGFEKDYDYLTGTSAAAAQVAGLAALLISANDSQSKEDIDSLIIDNAKKSRIHGVPLINPSESINAQKSIMSSATKGKSANQSVALENNTQIKTQNINEAQRSTVKMSDLIKKEEELKKVGSLQAGYESWVEVPAPMPIPSSNESFPPLAPSSSDSIQPLNPSFSTNESFAGYLSGSSTPPDTMGAVGPNHIVNAFNSNIAFQYKNGTYISSVSLSTFWSSLSPGTPFDPRVIYDVLSQRFIITSDSAAKSTNSALLLAVSATSDPTGSWYLYKIKSDPNSIYWADYPQVGINKKWIVIAANMFEVPNGGAALGYSWVINKSSVLDGGTANITVLTAGGSAGTSPSHTFDENEEAVWLAMAYDQNSGGKSHLGVFNINGSVDSPAYIFPDYVTIAPSSTPYNGNSVNADQLGTSSKIETNDDRILNMVFINGTLWVTHHASLPASGTSNRTAVKWWEINVSTGNAIQSGVIDDWDTKKMHYYYPSIAVNTNKEVLIGFSCSNSSIYVSACYAYRNSSMALGTMSDVVIYKNGTGTYTGSRWGDYSATVVDPADNLTFWTIQQIATGGYNVWWAKVTSSSLPQAPEPAPDTEYPIFSNYYDNNASLIGSGLALFNVTLSKTNGTVIININGNNYTSNNLTANEYNVSVNLNAGNYNYFWVSYGNGTSANYNSSETRYYTVNSIIDYEYPIFTNFEENPSDPVVYSSGAVYRFNATIINTNANAGIELNGVNYSMSNTSSIFNSAINDLGVNAYNYYFWAYGNGSNHNYNKTSTQTYTITKASSSATMSISGTATITYGITSDFAGSETNIGDGGCTYSLDRTNQVYGVGTITFNYSTSGCTNYSAGSTTKDIIINKATPEIYLYLNHSESNITINNGTQIKINASSSSSDNLVLYVNNKIYANSSNIYNVTSFEDTALYNVSAVYFGNQNYTANSKTFWINVTNESATQTTTGYTPETPSTPSSGGGGGGGGSGSSSTTKTKQNDNDLTENLNTVHKQSVKINDVVKVKLMNETEERIINVTWFNDTQVNVTISGEPIELILGEEKKVSITNLDFYELSIKVEEITETNASLSWAVIYEPIISQNKGVNETEIQTPEYKKVSIVYSIGITIIIAIVIAIISVIYRKKGNKKAKI